MISTIQERERFVSDLYYNQGKKNTREIAQEARMSFSVIGAILKKATEENENKQRANRDDVSSSKSVQTLF